MEEDTFFVESGGGDVDTDGGQRRRMAIASIPQEPIQQRAITTASPTEWARVIGGETGAPYAWLPLQIAQPMRT